MGSGEGCRESPKAWIDFRDASTVFGDPLATTIPDPDHSIEEQRFLTAGRSSQQKLIIVAHTDRGNHIRIMSARAVTVSERRIYEEGDERPR
jgi:uncharacterized protein